MGPMLLTNAVRVYNSPLSSVGYLRISNPCVRERERERVFRRPFLVNMIEVQLEG